MKRDWDLLRWILNEVESCGGGHPVILTIGGYGGTHHALNIGERNFAEVCEHMLLLGDSNLAEIRNLGRTVEGPVGVAIDRLTMVGHDFIEAARDETRWKKAMETVNEKGGGTVTVGILIQILSGLMKQAFGML